MATFADGVLTSSTDGIRIRPKPRLQHLGHTELEIKALALAERHHFIEARDGRVRRMLVVQLEGFLASNEETYRYALPDPVEMGDATWGSWVFCYSVAASDAPEVADTSRFLAERKLGLDDELIMARYARILGADARREALVFYTEPLRDIGHTLASLSDGDGGIRPEHASVAVELKARARRAFEVA